MASLVLTIKGADVTELKKASSLKNEGVQGVINHLAALASGAKKGTVYAQSSSSNPVAAAATITLTYASIAADDTVTIGNTVFTCTASGADGLTEFDKVTDATATAASLVTAINANTTTSKYFVASNVAGVVTVTCLARGAIGNAAQISTDNGTGFAVVAFAGGTGGASDTAATWAFGE